MAYDPGCSVGTQAKSTAPVYDTFEEVDLLSAIPIFGAWLTLHLLGIPTAPFLVTDFCAAPPGGDLPDAADWLKLAFPPLAAVTGTYGRLGNQIKAWKFTELCECIGGTGGTCAAAPYSISSPTDQGTSAGSRTTGIQTTTQVAGTYYGADIYCISGGWSSYVRLWDTTTTTVVAEKTHAFVTGLNRVLFPVPYHAGASENHTLSWTGSSSQHYGNCGSPNSGGTNNSLLHYGISTENSTDSAVCPTDSRTYKAPVAPLFCSSGAPDGVAYPVTPPPDADTPTDYPEPPAPVTCSTEQDICDLLNQIMKKIDTVKLQVDLIQKQHVPFEYQLSTVHADLAGTGEFTVSGILGLVVSVTDVPSTWGKTGDTPSRYIPALAALQEGDAQGFENWRLVHYLEETFFETHATSTTIRYNVKPGVTITVTELERVP